MMFNLSKDEVDDIVEFKVQIRLLELKKQAFWTQVTIEITINFKTNINYDKILSWLLKHFN